MLLLYAAVTDLKKPLEELRRGDSSSVVYLGSRNTLLRNLTERYGLQGCNVNIKDWVFNCTFRGRVPSPEELAAFQHFTSERRYRTRPVTEYHSTANRILSRIWIPQEGGTAIIGYAQTARSTQLDFSLNCEEQAHEVLDKVGELLAVPGGYMRHKYILELPEALSSLRVANGQEPAGMSEKLLKELSPWW